MYKLLPRSLGIYKRFLNPFRASSVDGLPGVRAMAFPHRNSLIEVACNVELFQVWPPTQVFTAVNK